jgi:cyanophycin synthetase
LIIVEAYIIGRDYRCLVIDGKIAAIAERVPAHVIAGGRTPSKLVAKTSADLRRGDENVLTRTKIDRAAIDPVAAQRFSMENCHPNGTVIKLTLTGSMSTGGITISPAAPCLISSVV